MKEKFDRAETFSEKEFDGAENFSEKKLTGQGLFWTEKTLPGTSSGKLCPLPGQNLITSKMLVKN